MKVKDLIFRNIVAKVFSLFFAVVLWSVVIGEKQAQVQLNVPLELVNIPKNTIIVSDIPSTISLQVQGPRTLLRTLSGRGIRKSIDLKGMSTGWSTVRILPEGIQVPRGIKVLRVSPSSLDLKLERVVARRVPIMAHIVGNPPEGYKIEASVEPPKVLLKGAESELVGLKAVKTLPLELPRSPKQIDQKVGLELEGLHLVLASPSKVLVRVSFSKTVQGSGGKQQQTQQH